MANLDPHYNFKYAHSNAASILCSNIVNGRRTYHQAWPTIFLHKLEVIWMLHTVPNIFPHLCVCGYRPWGGTGLLNIRPSLSLPPSQYKFIFHLCYDRSSINPSIQDTNLIRTCCMSCIELRWVVWAAWVVLNCVNWFQLHLLSKYWSKFPSDLWHWSVRLSEIAKCGWTSVYGCWYFPYRAPRLFTTQCKIQFRIVVRPLLYSFAMCCL